MIAADGEGATKLIEANVYNAKTEHDAKKAAKSIISSNLVKCAMFGNDPNWGRIMCALGYSGIDMDEKKIIIRLNKVMVFNKGKAVKFKKIDLAKKKATIDVNLNNGNKKATAFGCDMTYDYVEINAEYHT